jgi:hypothetical protein
MLWGTISFASPVILNLLIPDDYYETIAINLGYELIHKDSINLPDILGNSKHNSWISLWKKVK